MFRNLARLVLQACLEKTREGPSSEQLNSQLSRLSKDCCQESCVVPLLDSLWDTVLW